jgi:hypothetical protein
LTIPAECNKFLDSKDTFCDKAHDNARVPAKTLRLGTDNMNSKEISNGEVAVSRHLSAIIEAALFARDCLFFVPTAACIGIVGAAIFLSAKTIVADDHAKDARFSSNPGFKAAQHQQEAPALPGVQITVLRRPREQRMDECHSGSCLYGLQLAYPARQAQAHLALPQP